MSNALYENPLRQRVVSIECISGSLFNSRGLPATGGYLYIIANTFYGTLGAPTPFGALKRKVLNMDITQIQAELILDSFELVELETRTLAPKQVDMVREIVETYPYLISKWTKEILTVTHEEKWVVFTIQFAIHETRTAFNDAEKTARHLAKTIADDYEMRYNEVKAAYKTFEVECPEEVTEGMLFGDM